MKKCGRIISFLVLCLVIGSPVMAGLTPVQKLGELLYFDKHLSLNGNQSCATCHHPSAGYADPLNAEFPYDYPVSFGSDSFLNGGRNAPTSSYAAFIPLFTWDATQNQFLGGQFWDGRADTLKDQAKGPFLNPVEMGMLDEAYVIAAMVDQANKRADDYQRLFKQIYDIDLQAIDTTWNSPEALLAYDKAAEAIGTYEQTFDFTSFTSKYDYYLAGKANLNAAELSGLAIFESPQLGNCAACHPSQATIAEDGRINPPLFTQFAYENLGVPESMSLMLDDFPVDYGLGARSNLDSYNPEIEKTVLDDGTELFMSEAGKFRISSLRNIYRNAPYAHNGYFATLDEIVHFFNTRDVPAEYWPTPEVAENVTTIVGDLGLTPQQEADLVAFLKTLNDGYGTQTPENFVLPVMVPLN